MTRQAAADETEDGGHAVAEAGARFDPTPHVRQLRGRGGGEYLDVKWRLVWLRSDHPDAVIETQLVQLDPTIAVFKAIVTLPTGGSASGYGSETPSDFPDYIEKAETKAIGRALNALGYGAQFREPGDEESAPAVSTPPAPTTSRRSGQGGSTSSRRSAAATSAPPAPVTVETPHEAVPEPVVDHVPPPPADPEPGERAAAAADDLANFTWPAFRTWAKSVGFRDMNEVSALTGLSSAETTPAELRAAILEAFANGATIPSVTE